MWLSGLALLRDWLAKKAVIIMKVEVVEGMIITLPVYQLACGSCSLSVHWVTGNGLTDNNDNAMGMLTGVNDSRHCSMLIAQLERL